VCGIVGAQDAWLRQQGLDPETALRAALARLEWRGRDGQGLVRAGPWWLGCARLAISQPLSRQPVSRRGGRFHAVLNGAVTNARDLWRQLLPGAEQRAAPPNDAWLPLLAAAREPALLHALHGHHAFAVVDAGAGELWFGADPAGEKPLYRLVEAGQLRAFASTVPALAALGIAADLPAAEVARFFRCGFVQEVTAGGASLAPAASRRATRHAADGRSMASPIDDADEDGDAGEPDPATPPASLRTVIARAALRCSDAAVPVALSLSGGIDSSCLAAALAAQGRRVPAYQFCAAGEPADERCLANAVAAHCRLPWRPVDGGPEVLQALPELTRCAGLPLGDPSVLAAHAVARAAAADGVRILLSGEGADELFLGYRRHRALRCVPRLRVPLLGRLAGRFGHGHAARLLRALGARDAWAELLQVVPPAFLANVVRNDLPAPRWPMRAGSWLVAARERDRECYLRWDLLPKLDVATMAAQVEGRCPFLDPEVTAWAGLRTCAELLGKRPLRRAFANDLPAAVFAQPKRGFALPLDRWFRGDLPLLDLLREPRTRQREHLQAGGVDRAIDWHRRGRAELGQGLYLLAAFELWLRAREEVR
jgi:asparagine synthase (glutamine-hydrolysing)